MKSLLSHSIAPLVLLCSFTLTGHSHAQASKWKGMGVSTGAPLPPAENFKPRAHGPELAKAGLKPEVIASRGGSASGMSSQFKQRDKNNDGKLGRDELPAALFDKLDVNQDGFVSEEELKSLRRQN